MIAEALFFYETGIFLNIYAELFDLSNLVIKLVTFYHISSKQFMLLWVRQIVRKAQKFIKDSLNSLLNQIMCSFLKIVTFIQQ